jgi:hypothetical protein
MYGDKVLTRTRGVTIKHVAHPGRAVEAYEAFMSAAGEILAFKNVDFHVVSVKSGFGELGGVWSRRWHNIYAIDGINNTVWEDRGCSPASFINQARDNPF